MTVRVSGGTARRGPVLLAGDAWETLPLERPPLSPASRLAGSVWWGKCNTLVDNTGRGERL